MTKELTSEEFKRLCQGRLILYPQNKVDCNKCKNYLSFMCRDCKYSRFIEDFYERRRDDDEE